MTLNDLLEFVDHQDKVLIDIFHKNDDKEKILLARMAKLTEEVGELSEAVLSSLRKQGSYKENIDHSELEAEVADVILCALLIAKTTDCDVRQGLEKKITKINQRFQSMEMKMTQS